MGDGRDRVSVQGMASGWRGSLVLAGLAVVVLVAVLPACADGPEVGNAPTVT